MNNTQCVYYLNYITGIMEENYDDVDEMKAKVEEINNAGAKSVEPIFEESYDDLDTVAEEAREHLRNGKSLLKNF